MNGKISVYLNGKDNLAKCFDLADETHSKYYGYRVIKDEEYGLRMFIYWYDSTHTSDEVSWFPYTMDKKEITDFVWGWLKKADIGERPYDDDGTYDRGFRFQSDVFGDCIKGCDDAYVAVVVTPQWFYYGK